MDYSSILIVAVMILGLCSVFSMKPSKAKSERDEDQIEMKGESISENSFNTESGDDTDTDGDNDTDDDADDDADDDSDDDADDNTNSNQIGNQIVADKFKDDIDKLINEDENDDGTNQNNEVGGGLFISVNEPSDDSFIVKDLSSNYHS